jgi:phenylpropionate dioxygenase-like ring-hydroxylating dioxygenase large terminal subunit
MNQSATINRFGTANGHSGRMEYTPNGGKVPRLSGDIRHLLPPLGLREYWYPLCGAGRVGRRKPMRVKMLGDDICVFRGKGKDEIYALGDVCPHRGARLSEGDCHFAGTVACAYHGWVFDGAGNNIANLSEGPQSLGCGKAGTEARYYPTVVVKGIVWVWMGEGQPAPVEEDIPEEYFDPDVHVFFNERIYWRTNWEVALENTMDSHVQYLHRDYLMSLLGGETVSPGRGHQGARPWFTGYGFLLGGGRRRVGPGAPQPGTPGARPASKQAAHGEDRVWPKGLWRKYWRFLFKPFFFFMGAEGPAMQQERWLSGHQLPGMVHGGRPDAPRGKKPFWLLRPWKQAGDTNISFGLYTRYTVPVEEWLTRVWYMHPVVSKNKLKLAWYWLVYWTWARWSCDYNFSQQDMSVMLNLRYDTPEKLSVTDAEVVQWRRLVVTKHYGGRAYPFAYENRERGEPVDEELMATAVAAETRS